MNEAFDFRAVGGTLIARGDNDPVWDFGWVPDPAAVNAVQAGLKYQTAGDTPVNRISADELPKQVFLWDAYRKLFGKAPPARNQRAVGSCVGFGTVKAVEHTMCCEIVAGDPEEFKDLATEVIYGGSRVEVGGGRIRGDGSVGAWAADFVRKWGVVARGKYGAVDLSEYNERTCRRFGDDGVPADIEAEARLHPVTDVTMVTTRAEAKRMLAAGHAIAVCSDQGFTMQRDSRGVCRASGSWAHCMCIDGYVTLDNGDEFDHLTNSWGPNAHTGPVGWGDPQTDGFWAESRITSRMLGQRDSWAFAGVSGWRARILPIWLI